MTELALSVAFYVLIPATVAYLFLYRRQPALNTQDLKPNLLITRYPLLFVTGKRSALYHSNYWNQLPELAYQHGYESAVLELPWRGLFKRRDALDRYLTDCEKYNERVHLVIDESSLLETEDLLRVRFYSCLASVTLVRGSAERIRSSHSLRPLFHPIEELVIADSSKVSMRWQVHRAWSRSETFDPIILGLASRKKLATVRPLFLDHFVMLAEKDFNQEYRQQGTIPHERTESRSDRNQDRDPQVPAPSRGTNSPTA